MIDILTADHRAVTALLAEIEMTQDADLRQDLADIVITELVRHSVAE